MKFSELENMAEGAVEAIAELTDAEELEKYRVKWLGGKGLVRRARASIKQYEGERRIEFARNVNRVAEEITHVLAEATERIAAEATARRIAEDWIDPSLPSTAPQRGALHPVRMVELRCLEILSRLGFEQAEGPEVETDYFNFDALNIPRDHPARDMQDTFWVDGERLLRTHTTSVQARVLAGAAGKPVKVVVAGRVYRNEAVDATHLAMFHQLDGFWLDRGLTFAHLKGVAVHLARELYGERRVRLKPKSYPYTEPSVGIDVECGLCGGDGCLACHDSGWVTIMGAGMVHRNVLMEFGYDPDEISGFAFGWGLSRMTTQMYGLSRLRPIYRGDLRLLRALNRRPALCV
ncbi:phenylalanine--tRNA ligase subunit alpha [Streptomyces sp. ST2-7A]|uniref:phenylalanine--tRNA ligase subunit alpha n=1 Tax=Streptomyces sp. ST2-7A TaxID=2907214 RepID=UPI001F48D040|nr:phenylalanine--tRNA ligase subunit alpha [Streptomyces sp. ST2-7A]MCE7082635.1 phenylalanine--tRNA ligase subunit alpha [Streptomyces sp. ST2-7A]